MNEEFLITEERLDIIAKAFNISAESVRSLHEDFTELFESEIRKQHLAHLTHVLESYIKEIVGNPGFFIEYLPYGVHIPGMRGAMSKIYPSWLLFKKFTVYYDDTLPQKDIRVNLSHELGHLYLYARFYGSASGSVSEEKRKKFEKTADPLSNIFGVFVVSNKNHFYENLDYTKHKHPNWDSILEDFKNL